LGVQVPWQSLNFTEKNLIVCELDHVKIIIEISNFYCYIV